MQVCTSLQADNQASTPPLSFLQAGCSSCRPTKPSKEIIDGNLDVFMYEVMDLKLSEFHVFCNVFFTVFVLDGLNVYSDKEQARVSECSARAGFVLAMR